MNVCVIPETQQCQKLFSFPIPLFDNTIAIIGGGSDEIWTISINALQDYHQVAVNKSDRDKLSFFLPAPYFDIILKPLRKI